MEVDKKKIAELPANEKRSYQLSALIDADSFFYALFDGDHLLMSNQVDTADFRNTQWDHQLPEGFESAKIGVAYPYFTIVPAEDYHATEISSFVREASGNVLIDDTIFRSDFLPQSNAYLCYALPSSLIKTCRDVFDKYSICHLMTALLNELTTNNESNRIQLCRVGGQILMIAIESGKIKLVSTLNSVHPLTILYHLHVVQDSYGWDSDRMIIELSGELQTDDDITKIVLAHYPNTSFRNISLQFNGQPLDTTALYFPIRSIQKCA